MLMLPRMLLRSFSVQVEPLQYHFSASGLWHRHACNRNCMKAKLDMQPDEMEHPPPSGVNERRDP